MRRKYSTKQFSSIVSHIRSKIPNSSITTDLIVGFPGETKLDHDNTKDLLMNLELSDIHVFPYSIRPGTTAFDLKEKVQSSIITERSKEIREIAKNLNNKHLNSLVNTKQKVLWEKKSPYSGYTENYSYFKLISKKDPSQQISDVLISSVDNESNLVGILN